jgi:hypothetical protein
MELPIVPSGKYEGKSVLDLMSDPSTVEWYKQQVWFRTSKKWAPIYNIVVNQQLPNQSQKTPAHNKLQNMFLDKCNQDSFIKQLTGNRLDIMNTKIKKLYADEEFISIFGIKEVANLNIDTDEVIVKFEDKYNWDLVLYNERYEDIDIEIPSDYIDFDYKTIIEKYLSYDRYEYGTYISGGYRADKKFLSIRGTVSIYNKITTCCELKPLLGDDYPCVLRKLNTQIELTRKDKINFGSSGLRYVLIVGTFQSESATKEQLIEIFKQSNIWVVFTDEIFSQPIKQDTLEQDTLERVKQLEEQLFQAVEKNKTLELEIAALKVKKTKPINEYFVKS